ncbi:MAG TPA: S4 domain-containing protein, partial [Chitinophagaceae bacterium]|nr:S4 domain-containing protein [Chitinophagaceae bacterium]
MNTAILNTDIEEDELQDEAPKEKYIFFDFIIEKGQEPLRIDKYLMTKIANVTRNKIQQAIDDECVYVNDKLVKQNYKIKPEDHIVAYTFREPEST